MIAQEICALASGSGVPPDLVYAQVMEESGGQPSIVSSAGAVGLLQIMQKFYPGVDLTDPKVNIDIGTHILRRNMFYLNHKRAGWSTEGDIEWISPYLDRALWGYVMGVGNVEWYDAHTDKQMPANVLRYSTNIISLFSKGGCNGR